MTIHWPLMATKAPKKTAEEKRPKKLVLLDSHAILHRAYHALPELSSSHGEPTGALYGLITMLLKSIADLKPDYIVAAADRAEKTHRHEIYEEYKGTRAKTEDALVSQLMRAHEVFDAFGIPTLDASGYEADDVIGTVAKQLAARKDIETVILTGDMDMLQLVVDEHVMVYRLLTGISNMKFYDEAAVKERYGFGPEHVADYKGMCGDPSDNIKGIKGIGEKTATDLIQKFGTVEEIYEALKKSPEQFAARGVKPRVVELLIGGEEAARMSKRLATIQSDAPITFETPDHPWRLEDHAIGIMRICDTFEFRTLKERVRQLAQVQATPTRKKKEPDPAAQALPLVDSRALRECSIALWLLHSDTTNPSLEDILRYTKTDDFSTAQTMIFAELKKIASLESVYTDIEKPLIPIVDRMNKTGVYIDVPHMKDLAKEYGAELAAIEARIYHHAGREFNINSPKQLAVVLYDELKITTGKQKMTAGGARTTREEELLKMGDSHPIVVDILAHRELQKLLSTYIEKIPDLVGKRRPTSR
jgi:5'-3' exonuclease